MRHVVIDRLSGSSVVFHVTSQTARLAGLGVGVGGVIEHKMRALVFSKTYV
jgi:hypothetical protein